MRLRILSSSDVQHAVSMAEAIELVKGAFAQLSSGHAQAPMRTAVPVPKREGVTLIMPAYLEDRDALAVKVVSVFPHNAALKLPTVSALVLVVDSNSGQPMAVMDGTYLTALRTGAASGAATDLLARQDTPQVAILGAGVQGRSQLRAVCEVREVRRAYVYDSLPAQAQRFAEEMQRAGGRVPADIRVANSAQEAVAEADVICTATTSKAPVFDDADLLPGVHINGIGSYTPEMQEVDGATVARAKIVVDSRSACLAEAGDLVIPLRQGLISEASIHAELGEIVLGWKVGRESHDEVTFFKSVGNAVQDAAVAQRVLERAAEVGLGREMEM